MTDILDEEIRLLVVELVESAPQAPTLSELEWRDGEADETAVHLGRRTMVRRRPLVVGGGFGAIAAVILLVVLLLPSGQHEPVAAAAQLNQIADNVVSEGAPSLSQGQYLETESRISILATVSQVGSTPTPGALATITATITQWTDRFGDACVLATSSPAEFASPVNQAAWKAAGVLTTPTGQPVTSCSTVSQSLIPGESTPGSGIIDVSTLPTDPATLADQLSSGSTGIASLDQLELPAGENAGFERAADLLTLPVAGATPSFTAALFKAIALLPDVSALGETSTHSGATGLGFSGDSETGRSIIVVDPSTGALLEARNIFGPSVIQELGPSYLAPPPTPSIGTEGGSYGGVIQWFDPVGPPRVVDSLPTGMSLAQPVPVAAEIVGVANPGVGTVQLQALQEELGKLDPAIAAGLAAGGLGGAGRAGGAGGATVDFELTSAAEMHRYAQAMKSSGLFASITEYTSVGAHSTRSSPVSASVAAPSGIVEKVITIPETVYDQVGSAVPSGGQPESRPIVLPGQPRLTLGGTKPAVLYVGADYCPYSAADRWALVAALSRFGTWSGLSLITSSATDVDPDTHTFGFDGATYSSPYLSFSSVEQYSDVPSSAGGYTPLQALTTQERSVLNTYETPKFVPGAVSGSTSIPFIDIGNTAVISGAMFNPGILAGLSWSSIANDLDDPSSPVARSIVATANEITAAICATTKGLPSSVCNSTGVRTAAQSLGLG